MLPSGRTFVSRRQPKDAKGADETVPINAMEAPVKPSEEAVRPVPARWVPHVALAVSNVAFGGGSVVGKLGVSGTNPVLFAFIRESVAGPILLAIALALHPERPKAQDMGRIMACGLCVYANQFCFIVGLKLTDPTTGAVWQPSQPVYTAFLAIMMGYEMLEWRKCLGILSAVAGAAFMVCYPIITNPAQNGGQSAPGESKNYTVGNVLFFLNCLGTSLYVILSKPMLVSGVYRPLSVTAWSYLVAAAMMGLTTWVFNTNGDLLDFVCPPADCKGAWVVPTEMFLALAYWIFFQSVIAYGAMTWANAYTDASIVSAYTALQPFTSGVLSAAIILLKGEQWAVEEKGFQLPGVKDLGAVAIFAGLGLLVSVGRQKRDETDATVELPPGSDEESSSMATAGESESA
eukprot:gene17633-27137_t